MDAILKERFEKTQRGKFFPLWLSSETELHEVIRWKPYLDLNPYLRPQTTGRHSFSVGFDSENNVFLMSKYGNYDKMFISSAFRVHDLAEGFIQNDSPAPRKTDLDDLKEYLAFTERFCHLDADLYAYWERAFLLQFAMKCPVCFPEKAKQVMLDIQKTNRLDTLAFPALEAIEYIYYPWECYVKHGHEIMITHVLRNQIPRLQKMYQELPGFREEIFTPEYESWALDFIALHRHVPTYEEYFKNYFK